MNQYSIPDPPPWFRRIYPKLKNDFQVEFHFKNGESWKSNPGPQTWALLCPYDEILIGGRRGGSKTAALIAWFAMGDQSLDKDDPAYYSFLNDPSFRGLILRKEYQAMGEFIDECKDFFRPFEMTPKDDPVQFHFPSGAIIYTNHLQNSEAFEKYRGWGITKIGIEELTQIELEDSYLRLRGSLRGKKQIRMVDGKPRRKLRTQIMSTANPDGLGAAWVKARFVSLMTNEGNPIPWNSAVRNPVSGLTKVFIPMRLEDNPFLRDDKTYMGNLLEQSELKQRQWIHGDWDAAAGKYFSEFRPQGPIGDKEATETPWANHVIQSCELRPYWYRGGGGDWGFEHKSVFHKFCKNERDGRIHVYDELTVRQVGSFELGILVAKWWLPDLEGLPDKHIVLALSPDAFNKTDATKSRAEQFCDGIKQVLGPFGSFLLKYNDEEREAMKRDPKYAQRMFERRKQTQPKGQVMITVQPANNDRISGWMYITDLLRFRPVLRETQDEIRVKLEGTFNRLGAEAYERELAKQKGSAGPEVLPKLLIWSVCKEFIRGLSEAIHDDEPKAEDVRTFNAINGVGGDDGLSSGRYTLMSYKDTTAHMPKAYWVSERLDRFQAEQEENFGTPITDPTRLAMMTMTQNHLFDKGNQKRVRSFTPPRAGSSRHWNDKRP